MSKMSLTVWVPVDPERVRRKLFEHGVGSVAYIDHCQHELASMGYRFNPRQLARLREITEKYCAQWDAITEAIAVEHVGPPKGKVPPPGAVAFYERTGKCLVTRDDDELPGESRSRH